MSGLRLICWCFLFALSPLLAGGVSHADGFSVVVSIKPVHSILSGLMKDSTEPVLLIDGDDTPYDFQLSTQQEAALKNSDLVVWVGPELERSLQASIEKLDPKIEVMELLSNEALKILPSRKQDGTRDPFFWLDDRNAMILLDEFALALIAADPSRSHIYARNRREMLKPLKKIDREYEYGYRGLKAGLSVQYFDTLQYFEQAYALTTLDTVDASPYEKGDVTRLLKVRERLINKEATCLFTEKGMHPDNLSLLIEGQNVNVGELDSLGIQFEAGPELYFRLMQYNTDTIKRCLNADMDEASAARSAAVADNSPVVDGLGGRFILTDHMGNTVTEQDLLGHYLVMYFGYTFCPDVCPTGLQTLTMALQRMGEQAQRIRPYFITVDPDRDSVEVMRRYVGYFDPKLTGLTGSPAMIRRVADQFGAKFERVESASSDPDHYTMDHSASFYLMGPDGRFISKFAYGIDAETLARGLSENIR
jgi:protein SCO1/2